MQCAACSNRVDNRVCDSLKHVFRSLYLKQGDIQFFEATAVALPHCIAWQLHKAVTNALSEGEKIGVSLRCVGWLVRNCRVGRFCVVWYLRALCDCCHKVRPSVACCAASYTDCQGRGDILLACFVCPSACCQRTGAVARQCCVPSSLMARFHPQIAHGTAQAGVHRISRRLRRK